jgi:uridine kinase
VIGIAGGSGSGKTTFVKKLRDIFSEKDVCILSQDNYYKPREEQELDENNEKNFDLPTSFRREDFLHDVEELILGKPIEIPEYTYNNPLAAPKVMIFNPARVLILEGIFIYHFKEISDLMDLKLFVDVSTHLKLIRRIYRDKEERNYPVDDVLYRYEKHVYPSFEKFILPYKKECDIVINNNNADNFNNALQVVKAFIQSKI